MNAKVILPLVILTGLGIYYFSKDDKTSGPSGDTKATKLAKLSRKLTIYKLKLK